MPLLAGFFSSPLMNALLPSPMESIESADSSAGGWPGMPSARGSFGSGLFM
jgi:hypothetical protein